MLYALIMAGGSGTRFWPASRDHRPKQLLQLSGNRTMIQATADRLEGLVAPENIMVMTNQRLVDAVREQLPALPASRVLGEPFRRDTAPCVGLAAALFARQNPDAIMVVLPADHVITTPQQFHEAIFAGEKLLERNPQHIVTFGIRPTYPAESFGYVERGAPLPIAGTAVNAYEVIRFREKPDRITASEYLAAGTFYWNGGIFMWRAATLLAALKEHEPEMSSHLEAIAAASESPNFPQIFTEHFGAIKGKSIDYAVMEHYPHVAVIEAPFTWDDVGSWQAIARHQAPDRDGNAVRGQHIGIDTKNSIVQAADGHIIVTIDVDNLIVVNTADATLVAPKASEERVREAVKLLRERGLEAFL